MCPFIYRGTEKLVIKFFKIVQLIFFCEFMRNLYSCPSWSSLSNKQIIYFQTCLASYSIIFMYSNIMRHLFRDRNPRLLFVAYLWGGKFSSDLYLEAIRYSRRSIYIEHCVAQLILYAESRKINEWMKIYVAQL